MGFDPFLLINNIPLAKLLVQGLDGMLAANQCAVRCAMALRTTQEQRRLFCELHQAGSTYRQIAERFDVSWGCVRYWCRRQRDGKGCRTSYRRHVLGPLSSFDPLVRYGILRLRLEHPRWGPNRIRAGLAKRCSLRGLKLPSDASIGRYLHQWPRFRRSSSRKPARERPRLPTDVHQRWQIDFKVGIALADGQKVNLHTVRDPVGEACLGAFLTPAGRVGQKEKRVTLEQVRSVLRQCFSYWGTLPAEVQTDGEPCLVGSNEGCFPSKFTLWLKGLGIDHLVIHKVTDNAEVERCHRTVNDYAIVGQENYHRAKLQEILHQAVHELTFELSSRAEGCDGLTPIQAHPELLQPSRPFRPEHELAFFDLQRVDSYLATFTWQRKAEASGRVTIGGVHQRYSLGRGYAGQPIWVRFDPSARHFVFYDNPDSDTEIRRHPARNLEVEDLTGLVPWPLGLVPQQLPLPFLVEQGYVFNEQTRV